MSEQLAEKAESGRLTDDEAEVVCICAELAHLIPDADHDWLIGVCNRTRIRVEAILTTRLAEAQS